MRDAPSFYVRVSPSKGGQKETVDATTLVTEFKFVDDEKEVDKLILNIRDNNQDQLDSKLWVHGQLVEYSWGYATSFAPTRTAVIKKVGKDGPNSIKVECHDQAILMHKETKSRSFNDMSRSQVVEKIAKEHGYSVDALHVQNTEVVYDTVTQARLTDAQFLRHLAQKEGFEFFVDFDGLHWHPRKLGQKPVREFTYFTSGNGDITTFSIEGDLSGKPSSVKVEGRDPIEKKDISAEASNSTDTGRDTLGGYSITVDPRTLEQIRLLTGENVSKTEILPTSETDEASAKRRAKGRYRKSQANSFKLKFVALGDEKFVSKTVIKVSGIGQKLSGRYYVSKIEHIVGKGYMMNVTCKRDAASSGEGLGGEAETTKGKQNSGDVKPGGDLEPVLKVNPRTLEQTLVYEDRSGR